MQLQGQQDGNGICNPDNLVQCSTNHPSWLQARRILERQTWSTILLNAWKIVIILWFLPVQYSTVQTFLCLAKYLCACGHS